MCQVGSFYILTVVGLWWRGHEGTRQGPQTQGSSVQTEWRGSQQKMDAWRRGGLKLCMVKIKLIQKPICEL